MKKILVSIFSLAIVLSLSPLAAGQTGSSSLNDQLLQAATKGDTAAVQQLLAKGANINAKDNVDGDTALFLAAIFDHTEVVKLLLAKGANINARNNRGETALNGAERLEKNTEVAKLLREHGAH